MLAAGEKVRIEKRCDVGSSDGSIRNPPGVGSDLDHSLMREHPARTIAHDGYAELTRRRFTSNRPGDSIRPKRHRARVARNVYHRAHRGCLAGVIRDRISSKRIGVTRP